MQLGISILYLLTFLSLFTTFLGVSNALKCRTGENTSSKVAYTITVSQSGQGKFTKVQDAVDAIPSGNDQWIRIYVDSGNYWEQVTIPYDKECIVLEGHGQKDTVIVNDAHESTDTSATFISGADNFVAKSITFKNIYNTHKDHHMPKSQVRQAVATSVYGDKSAFYNCAFVGFQDTLWDVQGRHFFKSCYIQGAIDFIWGAGQSVYEDNVINVRGKGYITAQGRSSSTDPGGFVFLRGKVFGSGSGYLGRAYGPYSRVIFHQTHLLRAIDPLGWDAWDFVGHEDQFTYVEANCTGNAADQSKRVTWEKTLEESELSKYTKESFIDQDGWIAQQP